MLNHKVVVILAWLSILPFPLVLAADLTFINKLFDTVPTNYDGGYTKPPSQRSDGHPPPGFPEKGKPFYGGCNEKQLGYVQSILNETFDMVGITRDHINIAYERKMGTLMRSYFMAILEVLSGIDLHAW